MARSKAAKAPKKPATDFGSWGDNAVQVVVPSGIPLKLELDSDCILRFEGIKDISDKMKPPQDPGSVLYTTWFDGQKFVSMSVTYALQTALDSLEPGIFYYIHNQGEIETDLNPMKDFMIRRMGKVGDVVDPVPMRVHPDRKFTISAESVLDANFNRLNYPHRPETKG